MTEENPLALVRHQATVEPISGLQPYANNSRLHSDEQIQQIVASIKEFGFTMPILADEAGIILAGHARLEAAKIIGLEQVPVIRANGWTEAQKRAYVIADNKLALNASWDDAVLADELKALTKLEIDPRMTGFSFADIDALDLSEFEIPNDIEPKPEKGASHMVHKCPECGHQFR